jgi:hypothetical protein
VRQDSAEGEVVRRIGRHILNGLTVLSLVLSMATATLWARSMWLVDRSLWLPGGCSDRGYGFESGFGVLTLERLVLSRPLTADQADAGYKRRRVAPAARETFNRWLRDETWHGFGRQRYLTSMFSVERLNVYGYHDYLSVPYWAILLGAMVLPLAWLARLRAFYRARSRRRQGRCPACGYDLRGTPGRCPECGAIATKVKA